MASHHYGSDSGCMYCDAPRTEASSSCAMAEEIEAHWTNLYPGPYDPDRHLQSLVGVLRRRRRGDLTVDLLRSPEGSEVRFVVRRGPEIVAEAASNGRVSAAREAVARLWRWQARESPSPSPGRASASW